MARSWRFYKDMDRLAAFQVSIRGEYAKSLTFRYFYRYVGHYAVLFLSDVVSFLLGGGSVVCHYQPHQQRHKPCDTVHLSYLRRIESYICGHRCV